MDAYSSGGGGKLKLKGSKVSDGRVKKKKTKKSSTATAPPSSGDAENDNLKERDVADSTNRDRSISREGSSSGARALAPGEEDASGIPQSQSQSDSQQPAKTQAERRHEEMRRKRVQERLKREGVKTHKERVEELNKYLSRLSEHHDMPKIGPG
ncbi:hypothetical protein BJY04DRAFT_193835 [Aspergillus karnatakaensis]|uniref:uncharacterized protein n=1 Tax=Aspergillus karnatakaensis TaxID=1810916 RepID=UPI003CCE1659